MRKIPMIAGFTVSSNRLSVGGLQVFEAARADGEVALVLRAKPFAGNWARQLSVLNDAGFGCKPIKDSRGRVLLSATADGNLDELTGRLAAALSKPKARSSFYADIGWLTADSQVDATAHSNHSDPSETVRKTLKLRGALVPIVAGTALIGVISACINLVADDRATGPKQNKVAGNAQPSHSTRLNEKGNKTFAPTNNGVALTDSQMIGILSSEKVTSTEFEADLLLDPLQAAGFEANVSEQIAIGGEGQLKFAVAGKKYVARYQLEGQGWNLVWLRAE